MDAEEELNFDWLTNDVCDVHAEREGRVELSESTLVQNQNQLVLVHSFVQRHLPTNIIEGIRLQKESW